MPRRRADSEMEPVAAIAARSSALPGPIAISVPNITLSLVGPRLCRFRAGNQLLQLARLEHLLHDVAAADELALHVELRDGRPVGELLDALADLRVLQHDDGGEVFYAAGIEHPADKR